MITCPRCQKQKPISEFYPNKTKLGRDYYCKECRRILTYENRTKDPEHQRELRKVQNRRRWEKDRDKILARNRAYQQAHSEESKLRSREYRQSHREQVDASIKRWRNEHPDLVRAYALAWIKKNPEKVNVNTRRRQARKMSLPNNFQVKDWEYIVQLYGHKCIYCGSTHRISIDHFVPISRGGPTTVSNIVPACLSCNCSKNNHTPSDWVDPMVQYAIENIQYGLEQNVSINLVLVG